MNRRTFGKLTFFGALAGLTKVITSSSEAEPGRPPAIGERRYQPTLTSLRRHSTPEWFRDLKLGMFIDFGLYSVAGYAPKRSTGPMYPDWYLYNMYHVPEVVQYHREKWGPGFQRDDFIPLFKAERFNPEAIVTAAVDAGMRYVVPFCKHHDGFCLWPSSYTDRNALKMGPRRDLIGPLREACRKRGLKFGFYFSLEEWEYPVIRDGKKMLRIWSRKDDQPSETVPFDEAEMVGKITGKIPVRDFTRDYIVPQAEEFIDRYDPEILWFDGDWTTPVEDLGSREIVSYFYNKALGRTPVAVNDRLGRYMRFNAGDFFTSEYGAPMTERLQVLHAWEENRGVSQSFGYNWQDTEENVISAADLVDLLARVVSQGGNLLLIVNLDGQGVMPDYIRSRIGDLGRWLRVNGEAIYGTRPWLVASQGDQIRFTLSGDRRYLYAIHRGWPDQDVELHDLWLDSSSKIELLGAEGALAWKNVPEGKYGRGGKVAIEVPQALKTEYEAAPAVVIRVELSDSAERS